jgi:hypothetical protein
MQQSAVVQLLKRKFMTRPVWNVGALLATGEFQSRDALKK